MCVYIYIYIYMYIYLYIERERARDAFYIYIIVQSLSRPPATHRRAERSIIVINIITSIA